MRRRDSRLEARLAAGAITAAALIGGPAIPAEADSWGAETNVSQTLTDSETGLSHRSLAMTPDGTLHVVWAERDGPQDTYRVWTRRRSGGTWEPSERLVDYLASDPGDSGDDIGAKYPSLAVTPSGDLHLFWHDYRIAGIENVEIFWKMRAAGSAWDPSRAADIRLTTSLHPESQGDNSYVPVPAVSPAGDVHVTWYDYRFDAWNAEILTKSRPAGGNWDLSPGDSADVRITNDAGHSELVDVASDSFGALHAVWRSVEAGGRVRWARRDPAGTWSVPIVVDDSSTVAGAPACTVDGDDTLHVIWPDSRDGGRALFTQTRSAAGVWSQEARITRPAEGADEPSLATNDDGTLHLAFSDGRVSLLNREIFHRQRAPGAAWDTTGVGDTRLSDASGQSTRPSVDATGGTISVMWKDVRDGNHEIYIRQRIPTGTGVEPGRRPIVARLSVTPNPVRLGGRARLRSATAVPVSGLVVFDIGGRIVHRLPPGRSAWDLTSTDGRAVTPGTYFLRDAAGATARVTVRQ